MTVTNDRITNPRSTDYVYKDDLRSHKIKMGEGPGGTKGPQSIPEDSVQPCRWLPPDRSSRVHGQRGRSHVQLLDGGGAVNAVCRDTSAQWAQVS